MTTAQDPLDTALLPDCVTVGPGGRLRVGGRPLDELVADHDTPLFIYDLAEIRRNFERARALFGHGVAYATKAFVSGEIVRLADDTGLSLDVSTDGEYELALAAGFPADRLVIHGNNKSDWLLERAVTDGVQWIVIDADAEITRLVAVCERLDATVRVMVRVNPGVEVHTHEFVATGNRTSKFGIPAWTDAATTALARVAALPRLDLQGVHTHIGSLVYSLDNFEKAIESLGHVVDAIDPDTVVVGGGLGVRYLNSDVAPSLASWATATTDALRRTGFAGRVLAEPGRCLVAGSALTVYSVGAVKEVPDQTIVAVDGGMSDNPRPILYDSGYEVALADAVDVPRTVPIRLVGSHCESGDTLVHRGWVSRRPTAGDLLITPVTGAYGYAMASNYNRMRRPAILFVDGDRSWVGVRRESFADMRACDRFFDDQRAGAPSRGPTGP